MYVLKRNGETSIVQFDKITTRIQNCCKIAPVLSSTVDPVLIAQKVVAGIYSGVKTTELDNLAAETAAYMTTVHTDYGILASRIAITNLHKETPDTFSEAIEQLHSKNLVSTQLYQIVQQFKSLLDEKIIQHNDFLYDFFGYRTLEKAYLIRIDGKIIERPQYMLMRVALGIHGTDLDAALETYQFMSERYFTHATPTLFNAGTNHPQLSSCFLLTMTDDSVDGIYDTLTKCAQISKYAGGIGLSIHNIRAKNSLVKGTNGISNGIVPMLKVFNETARFIDQGGGRRKGSIAIYLEPWHLDIFDFLNLKLNHGKEDMRARDLFYGLWIPDLFMKRVEYNQTWTLFSPDQVRPLYDNWGDKFEQLYLQYERDHTIRKEVIRAQDLWFAIIKSQIETGTPYILYKDSCNRKSNQQNLGCIRSSNLCTEIIEYSSADEIAVCNLASIALPQCVIDGVFSHQKLYDITSIITVNLNKIIDVNFYPVPETERSNKRHRPIGIGVQGLADVFMKLGYPFESKEAQQLNKDIFETIYYASLMTSCKLAQNEGVYSSYQGSPASKGILQYDMWGVVPSDRWNWEELKNLINKYGLRNSLLVAPMPTASTSQILGNNECFEPYTSNIYTRRVLSGEFTIVNKYLVAELEKLGLWNLNMKNKIVANNGSVQDISEIPYHIRAIYKTVWEISQRTIIDMGAERGAFIDQSQSFNVFMAEPNLGKLTSLHFYAWKKGLKTGMYYLRTKPKAQAIQFTVQSEPVGEVCRKEEGCIVCSS